jgi:hypothetical protein
VVGSGIVVGCVGAVVIGCAGAEVVGAVVVGAVVVGAVVVGAVVGGWAGAVAGCVVVDVLVADDVEVEVDVDVADEADCVVSAVTRVGVEFFQSSMLVESESTAITDSPDARAISMAWVFGYTNSLPERSPA